MAARLEVRSGPHDTDVCQAQLSTPSLFFVLPRNRQGGGEGGEGELPPDTSRSSTPSLSFVLLRRGCRDRARRPGPQGQGSGVCLQPKKQGEGDGWRGGGKTAVTSGRHHPLSAGFTRSGSRPRLPGAAGPSASSSYLAAQLPTHPTPSGECRQSRSRRPP